MLRYLYPVTVVFGAITIVCVCLLLLESLEDYRTGIIVTGLIFGISFVLLACDIFLSRQQLRSHVNYVTERLNEEHGVLVGRGSNTDGPQPNYSTIV